MTDGPVMGSVMVVPGIVGVGEGTAIWLMSTTDGHSLFKTWDTTKNSKYYVGPTIANGVLYIGNKNGKFYTYAPPSTIPTPTVTPSPTVTVTPSPSPTLTPSPTATITPSPTVTVTSSPSSTPTPGTIIAQDTFQRANQPLWGTASNGLLWGNDANSNNVFSIVNNTGQVSGATALPNAYSAMLGPTVANVEVLTSGSISSFTGSFLGASLHWTNANNYYRVYISGTNLVLVKKVAGIISILKQTPFTATAGISYTIRFRIVGTTLYTKAWQTSITEPANWTQIVTDSSLASGLCGLYIQVQTGRSVNVTSFQATAE
jgi:hypothetical protein